MLTCKDASHLLSQAQERPLSVRERMGLRLHLWLCVNCRRFDRQLGLLRQALRQLGKRAETEAGSRDLSADARARIRRVLTERSGGGQ